MKPRILPATRLSFPFASAIAALLAGPAVQAGTLYWKTATAGSWTGLTWGAVEGGPYTSGYVSGSDVVFEANAGTTLTTTGATTAFTSITANENVTVTAGGTLATGGTVASITVAEGKTLDFAGQSLSTAAGTGFIKNGAGTWSLANGNAYTGGFTLNAGTVAVGGVNAMGAGGALTINGGTIRTTTTAARDLSGKYTSITIGGDFALGDATNNGLLTFSNATNLGAATRTITLNSNATFSGNITGGSNVGINKSGPGTLTLSGANSYTGNTRVDAGTLQFTNQVSLYNNGVAATWSKDNLVVANGATVVFNVGGVGQFTKANINTLLGFSDATTNGFNSGSILGIDTTGGGLLYDSVIANPNSGTNVLGLTKLGTNTLTLDQDNTYTGRTVISAGTLQLGNGSITGKLSTSSTILNNGTFTINRSDAVAQGTDFSAAPIVGTGAFIQAGGGTTTLSAANTFSGSTTVSAGALNLTNGLALQNSALVTTGAGNLTLTGPTTLTVGGLSGTSGNLATVFSSGFTGTVTALTLNPLSGSVTYGGVIANGGMTLNKTGAGTQILSGANTYTGTTTINSGTLQIGNSTTGSLNGTTGTALTFGGTSTFNVQEAAGVSQGMGALTLSAGDGTVTSTWNNGAGSGNTALTFASLAARTAGATANFTLAGTGSTATNNRLALTSTTNAPLTTTSNDAGIFFGGTGYARYNATTNTFGAVVYGTNTNANAQLTGAQTTLGSTTSATDTQYLASTATTSTVNTASSNSTTLIVGNSALFKVGAPLTGTGIGSNTWVTAINSGTNTLTLSANATVAANATITPYNSVSAQTTGAVNTVNLTGTGSSLTLASGATLGTNGILLSSGSTTVANVISGGTGIQTNSSGGEMVIRTATANDILVIATPILANGASTLTKSGLGTLTFNTASTFTGGTTINAGTITFGVNNITNPLGAGTTTVNAGGTLLPSASVFTATIALNGGTLNVGNSFGSSINGSLVLNANSTMSVSGNLTINGNISGAAGFTKTLAAIVPVLGTNTYAGPTIISGGGLRFRSSIYGNDTSKWTPANITVGSGAALILYAGGSGDFTTTQAGTMFTQLATGLNNNGLLAGSFVGIDTSTSGAGGSTTFSTVINDSTGAGGGAVGFRHVGLGTLILSGANTYSGPTITDNDGTLRVSSINSVFTNATLGTVHSASSSLGAPTTIANGTIQLGSGSTFKGGNLTYTGSGETTDRVINLGGANATSYTFDQSGTGLLKFLSGFTITDNRGVKTIVLQGSTSGTGEMAGVLPLGQASAPNVLLKTGTGTWTLSAANLYAGTTTIQAGSLVAGADSLGTGISGAFGASTAGAIVLGNGSTTASSAPALLINGAFTVGRAITVGSVAAAGVAYNATIGGSNTTGTSNFTGNITLNTTANSYTATLQAATGGTVNFSTGTWTTNNKAVGIGSSGNTGTVRLSNAIATSGGISVNFGTLELNSAFTAGNMTVASGTTLKGTGSVAGTTGVTGGTVNGTGLVLTGLTTFNSTGNILSGTVTSNVALASGAALANNGALTGNMTVGNGTLSGTGSVSGTTGVTSGTVNGTGLVLTGATTFNGTGNILSGTVTSNVTLASGAALANNGALTGTLAIGNGTLTGASGSVSGAATLNGGNINLTSGAFGSTLGVTGGTWSGAGSATGLVTSSSGTFTIGSGANLTANGGLAVTGGTLVADSATSKVTGSLNYTSSSDSSFAGEIAGSGNSLTINNASATLTLTGTSSYTGATNVTAGRLVISGNISTSLLTTVESGATLAGNNGTVGALTINSGGFVTPGNSPGSLNVAGNYTQAGQYTADLSGTIAGTDYDQITVAGTVDITGGNLVTVFSGSYSMGDMLFILLNDGTDSITGNYLGFGQGATAANFGGFEWVISYNADSNTNTFTGSPNGNDIVLMAVPEPGVALLGGLGLLALLRRRRD